MNKKSISEGLSHKLMQVLLIYALPSHNYFIQLSIVVFEKQIILIGKLATENCVFVNIDKNIVEWKGVPSGIEIV